MTFSEIFLKYLIPILNFSRINKINFSIYRSQYWLFLRLTNFSNLSEKYLNIHDFSKISLPFLPYHIPLVCLEKDKGQNSSILSFILSSHPRKKKKTYTIISQLPKNFFLPYWTNFPTNFRRYIYIYIFDEPSPVNIRGNIHQAKNESIRVATESSRGWRESTVGTISKRAHGLRSWPSWEALPAERGTRWLCHCQKVILRARPEDKSLGRRGS